MAYSAHANMQSIGTPGQVAANSGDCLQPPSSEHMDSPIGLHVTRWVVLSVAILHGSVIDRAVVYDSTQAIPRTPAAVVTSSAHRLGDIVRNDFVGWDFMFFGAIEMGTTTES